MKSSNFHLKVDDYQYQHVYDVFRNYFEFDEAKYEYLIKDIIKVLMEFEKKGETIIDVDKVQINFDLNNNNWPDAHIKCLNESGLNNLINPPIANNGRIISWSKWSNKLEKIEKKLLKKINIDIKENINFNNSNWENKIDLIKNILNYSNLVLLEGGPGTGKTTLIINFILSYLQTKKNLNIGLAAPTGKATARIKEALNYKLDNSLINSGIIDCQTLHGWIYNSTRLGKLKIELNELDIFVIDECSMLSIDIIDKVLELINSECKIILVGDANQLPPINNCSIWNNIFENSKDNLFKFIIVKLNKIYRNNGDIQELSKLIFYEDQSFFIQKVNSILKSKLPTNVFIDIRKTNKLPNKLRERVILFVDNLKRKTAKLSAKNYIFKNNIDNLIKYEKELVLDIFKTLNSQLILTARNSGSWSVKDVNSIVIKQNEPYDFDSLSEGIPIMCIENNNELGISNGDIGVLIGKNETRRFLFRKFNKENELIFALIEPYRLDKVIPALAVTIHKSQGSEAENVIILWNKDKKNNQVNNIKREFNFFRDTFEKRLLYTGITRAKNNLDIFYLD